MDCVWQICNISLQQIRKRLEHQSKYSYDKVEGEGRGVGGGEGGGGGIVGGGGGGRKLRNSEVKLRWWWVVVGGGGMRGFS